MSISSLQKEILIISLPTSFNEGDFSNKTYKKSLLEIETEQELDSVEDFLENSTRRFSDVSQQISEGENGGDIWIKQSDTRSIATCKSDQIGNSVDFPEMENSIKSTEESCEEEIVECLLKHYKYLSVFGIRFTWLGVHKIYRVALVACRTFITEPVVYHECIGNDNDCTECCDKTLQRLKGKYDSHTVLHCKSLHCWTKFGKGTPCGIWLQHQLSV